MLSWVRSVKGWAVDLLGVRAPTPGSSGARVRRGRAEWGWLAGRSKCGVCTWRSPPPPPRPAPAWMNPWEAVQLEKGAGSLPRSLVS